MTPGLAAAYQFGQMFDPLSHYYHTEEINDDKIVRYCRISG